MHLTLTARDLEDNQFYRLSRIARRAAEAVFRGHFVKRLNGLRDVEAKDDSVKLGTGII